MNTHLLLALITLIAFLLIQQSQGLPAVSDQDPFKNMPADVLFQIMTYLSKKEIDNIIDASPAAAKTMWDDFHYNKTLSIIGTERRFVHLSRLQLPPPDIHLYYIYACANAYDVIESSLPLPNLNRLLKLHIKFCTGDDNGLLERLMIDKFLALSQQYTYLTDLQMFGPAGHPFAKHLYDYLDAHPKDDTTLATIISSPRFDMNQQYERIAEFHRIDCTMIQHAAYDGNSRIVQKLIEFGADILAQDSHGDTPLLLALRNQHADIALLLINAGADVNVIGSDRWTPLLLALRNTDTNSVVALLAAGANVNVRTDGGWTPLHLSVRNGLIFELTMLIDSDADVNVVDVYGRTPLRVAAQKGDSIVVSRLIYAGANLDTACHTGWTPLLSAIQNGHVGIAITLINAGANVTISNNHGWTPLFVSVQKRYGNVVDALRAHGASA